MANEFLNTFTDRMADNFLIESRLAKDAWNEGNLQLYLRWDGLASKTWDILYEYDRLILSRKKFNFQSVYCREKLQSLDKERWDRKMLINKEAAKRLRRDARNAKKL